MNAATRKVVETRFNRFGWAWVLLCVALAVHVADEALTDFLSIYNPLVSSLRERFGFFPMPAFEFRTWLAGLITVIALLLALSPLAFSGVRWVVRGAYLFGFLMIANGVGHVAGSFYFGKPMSGVYSAPLLLVCSCFLLVSARKAGRMET
jgi:hypothetical protein